MKEHRQNSTKERDMHECLVWGWRTGEEWGYAISIEKKRLGRTNNMDTY